MAKRKKKRKVPLGKIKSWSDETIDRKTTVTEDDIAKAKAEAIDDIRDLVEAPQREETDIVGS
jgi:hypothetical protein